MLFSWSYLKMFLVFSWGRLLTMKVFFLVLHARNKNTSGQHWHQVVKLGTTKRRNNPFRKFDSSQFSTYRPFPHIKMFNHDLKYIYISSNKLLNTFRNALLKHFSKCALEKVKFHSCKKLFKKKETDHAWTVLNSRNANVSTAFPLPLHLFTQHLSWISWGDKRPESGAVGSCLIWKLTLGASRLQLSFIHSLLSATVILKSTANGKK